LEKRQDSGMVTVAEPYPCLHQLFEAQVQQSPGAIACIFEGKATTYEVLNQQAQRLACYLQQQGIGCETLVCLYIERSLDLIIGILGILKAGGAYVPLDPSYPLERLAFMVTDTQVPVILTQTKPGQKLSLDSAKTIYLDSAWQSGVTQQELKADVTADNLAYVIYTSGSTGRPKGIAVPHRGVVNNILDLNQRFAVGSEDRILMLSSLSFDMCVYEVLGMLAAGGTVIIPDRSHAQNPAHWAELTQRYNVTLWNLTPALLKMLVHACQEQVLEHTLTLKLVLTGGDWIPVTLPEQVKSLAPHAQVVSLGGATEASICSIIYPIEVCDPAWKRIPYGWPMANQEAWILDAELQPVQMGVPGELYLGGMGLVRGYINGPALTAERFIPHPFSNRGDRLYKTGDLACYQPNGTIELLGRIDYQVKLRGVRIELEEIEANLRQYAAIQDTVVLIKEDNRHNQFLVAYFVPKDAPPTFAQLRNFLKQKLPDAMIPTVFVPLASLPLTLNRKLDRLALLALPLGRRSSSKNVVTARTPLEEVLAKIWGSVLGIKQVGIFDNFFEMGGHSLLATQIVSRLQEAFQVDIPLNAFFEAPEVAQFAEYVLKNSGRIQQDIDQTAQILLQIYQLSEDDAKRILSKYTEQAREEVHENIQPCNPSVAGDEGFVSKRSFRLQSLLDSNHAR
jgi:amino acid adenylation domain-containing protein